MKEKSNQKANLTLNSKIGAFYQTPIGHDTIFKVLMQMGLSEKLITNKLVSNMKLKTVARLTKKQFGEDFFNVLLHLVNSEEDVPFVSDGEITKKWWKEAVFYQIYPRSFHDTNGDGIGDLRGIINKLDYLKELGVNALWLSPIYDSPNDDNGYDIRDYHKIMKEFGTMEDFDELLSEVHKRDMRLIMDLVVNHTSDEHEWFQSALKDKNSPYRDYYFFSKAPNNWTSFFSGPAWNHYEEEDIYALHLFSKKQMDLNWDNEKVRADVIKMVNWWLSKGVDGFRMDVINYISKESGLPMGNEVIGNMMGFTGIEKYYYGPNLHKYLKQVRKEAFDKYDAFSVGETPGIGMNMCQLITGEERKELDMVFSFDHLETPGHVRFDLYEYDLNYYRDYIVDWMLHYGNNCWMSLFYNNHDNPRMVSKITSDKAYQGMIQKLLAVMQFTLRGTPFIFQGDEMGLVNYNFKSMDEITDVEAKGYFDELLEKGKTKEEAFEIIAKGTREHGRILLPWEETLQTASAIVRSQAPDMEIHETYKKLIALRKEDAALVYGDFTLLSDKKDRFVYKRSLDKREYVIDCNLGKKVRKAYPIEKGFELVYDSAKFEQKNRLNSYEVRIWVR